MKALLVMLALIIPASVLPSETKTVTGYLLIAHHCSTVGEAVILVFSDGSFLAERVERIPEHAWEELAKIRMNAQTLSVLINGPFDSCPTRS